MANLIKGKILNVDGKEYKYVTLTRGTYSLNGTVTSVENTENVEVSSFDDLREIQTNTVVSHYESGSGRMEVHTFKSQVEELKHKGTDDYGDWFDFELEYQFKKFIDTWTAVYKNTTTLSDPIPVEIESDYIRLDNEYIQPVFRMRKEGRDYSSEVVSTYDRGLACFKIALATLDSLGMEQESNNFNSTKGNKKYRFSREGLDSINAFGTYVFPEHDWKKYRFKITGKYGELVELYEADKKKIEKYLQRTYNLHYGELKADTEEVREKLIECLRDADYHLRRVTPHKSTKVHYNNLISKVNQLEELLSDLFK